jgi:hypothetical protein
MSDTKTLTDATAPSPSGGVSEDPSADLDAEFTREASGVADPTLVGRS